MADKKLSFKELTEDLENKITEPVAKSEDPKETEQKTPEVKPEGEEAKKEEPVTAEEGKEGEQPETDGAEDVTPESDSGKKETPKPGEPVKKSEGEEKPEDADKGEDGKKEEPEAPKEQEPAKEEPVEKSQSSEEGVSGEDLLDAFEVVTKSYGNLNVRMEAIEKSLAEIAKFLKPAAEAVAKSVETKEEDKPEEQPKEELEKSATEEEAPEGKAVEFVSKSNDGVAVPDAGAEEAPATEEQPEPEFKAEDHLETVKNYFFTNHKKLDGGKQAEIRAAVSRVKRGEAFREDVELFKEISGFGKK